MSSYIFFGHGWDLGNTFLLDKHRFGCVKIIMLSEAGTLYEPLKTKHLRALMKMDTIPLYMKKLYKYTKKHNIDMCIFDSNTPITNIPILLLTTSRKTYGEELTSIRKLGSIRETTFKNEQGQINVFLLPELLEKLREISPIGDLNLILWTCRSPFDKLQFHQIQEGEFEKSREILTFITRQQLIPLETGVVPSYPLCNRWNEEDTDLNYDSN